MRDLVEARSDISFENPLRSVRLQELFSLASQAGLLVLAIGPKEKFG